MNTQNHELKGKKIAILATDGFEQSELTEPSRTWRTQVPKSKFSPSTKARSKAGTKPTGDPRSRSIAWSMTPTPTSTTPSSFPAAS